MKSFLKGFYVAIVAIVVFVGVLYIFEGVRTREERAEQSEAEHAQTRPDSMFDHFDFGEGSAL